jgi:DNA polymerase-3 subunit gamma/tau
MPQKYQVLARRYRPQRFSEVVGQEAILQTLRNALKRSSIAHAYLFCGSRGVGKTTLARLFAKALNCAAPIDGEPCNSCPSCLEIAAGQSLDVIEIDGASNRGIDDIRQINETVSFAPSHGQYKIYIIDEVHMLTKEAFNALLKTLEEPPERAKFFFATTEPHKVLPTIISRCQRFDLGRLLPAQIAAKLESISADLGRKAEPEALRLLAHYADGSLRDAESLFDQILCFAGPTVTAADVRAALGLVPSDFFTTFDQAFANHHLSYAFELTDQLFQSGKDLSHFLDQLIEHFRHLTVCKTLTEKGSTPERIASARLYTQSQLLSILDLLLKAEMLLTKSASPRVTLELTLLNILRLKNQIPIEVLVRRLSDLEERLGIEQAPEKKIVTTESTELTEARSAQKEEKEISALPELKAVPFNPFKAPAPEKKIVVAESTESTEAPSAAKETKHPSHYETVMRFAAVELEGTIRKQ